ncbi:MAG TPA: hypothetical protein V6C58_12255, partial [Allocoleopsis sp.]
MRMRAFFTSAIAMMNRLKYPQKFALISAIFVVPIILLVYLLFSDIYNQINLDQKKILGNVYLAPLQEIWVTIPEIQLLNTHGTQQEQIQKEWLEKELDQKINILAQQEKQLNNIFKTADYFQNIQQIWQRLKQDQKQWSIETIDYFYNHFLNEIENLRVTIGNESNLIFDPYAASYYLIDVNLLTLPKMQKILGDIKSVCVKAMITEKFTPNDYTQLLMLLSLYKNYSIQLMKNVEFAFHNLADTPTPKLIENWRKFTININQINMLMNQLIYGINIPEPVIYFNVADQNLKQSIIFGNNVISELDILLQHRVNMLWSKMIDLGILIIMVLSIAIYLFICFYLGVM